MASIRRGDLIARKLGNAFSITLNRPKALNALNHDMAIDLRDILADWHKSAEPPKYSALIVSGAGGKAFCAGGDVKAIWDEVDAVGHDHEALGLGYRHMLSSDFFRDEYEMNYLVGKSKIPQVSLWNGIVMGGGVGLSVLGQFRVATEKTTFAMPETAIGLFPDVGSSSWLPFMPNGLGEFIGLTGTRLNPGDLYSTGIATHFIRSDKLEAVTKAISELAVADSTQERSQRVAAVLDDFAQQSGIPDLSQAVTYTERDNIASHFHGKASMEEIMESLAGRRNDFARNMLTTLQKMSPSSLKLTFEQMVRGRALQGNLGKCLEMEYNMVQGCMRKPDFKEGVRALLIDKDNRPMWNPATLAAVTPAHVESYFQFLAMDSLFLHQFGEPDVSETYCERYYMEREHADAISREQVLGADI